MAEVKALYPIGKTQWSKWRPEQKIAFNEARAAGVPFADAVAGSNQMKKGGLLKVLKDAADAVDTVAEVVETVAPVVSVAKTLVKAAKKGK